MNVISAASSAIACANIALIKYWGKRETARNLPAVGSISLTLEALRTETTVKFDPLLDKDSLAINQMAVPETQRLRVSRFLDLIRREAGHHTYASVTSTNNFPTGAGLASSASAFAALTLAAANAAGLTLTEKELSVLARQGSGSAARSVYGGIVEMKAGHDLTGDDDYAMQLADENYWDLKLLILITSVSPKGIGSTDAMNATAVTSAYYQKWVDTADQDLAEMRVAIEQKDFDKLGELAEYSAMKMHALIMSSRPAIIYWNPLTLELIHLIRELRYSGLPVYFTIDAGPQIKLITLPEFVPQIRQQLAGVPGILKIFESGLGEGVRTAGDRK